MYKVNRINGFKQISAFYSWVFENQDKVKPHHVSLYVFLWNQDNRANWVEYFKCPFDLAITGACIGNRNTYYKTLNELQQWGLIQYQKGINEYKAPIIKLVQLYENDTSTDTSTDTPTVTPINTPTDTASVHIYNYITNNIKLITKEWEKIKKYIESLNAADKSATQKTLEERQKDFYNELVPFVDKYGKDMIRSFFNYWSQVNKNGKKMLWEMQQAFELPKRLSTWHGKEHASGKNNNVGGEQLYRNNEERMEQAKREGWI